MNFQSSIVLLLVLNISIFCVKSELIFVNELFRHGARGTLASNMWNSDDYKDIAGELTGTGMRQHYTLGTKLREEYVDKLQFLDPEFNYKQFEITCTQFNRTLQSAYSQLQGFFPPHTGSSMNEFVEASSKLPPFKGADEVNTSALGDFTALPNVFQPVPVHVNETALPYPPLTCPNFSNIVDTYYQVTNKNTFDKINTNYQTTYDTFTSITQHTKDGDKPYTFMDMENVWDVMVADLNSGFPLPPEINNVLWQNLTELDTLYWFYAQNGDANAVQLQNTDLFQKWKTNMEVALSKDNYKEGVKWSMFSAHDNNVAGAEVGLGFTNWQCLLNSFWNTTEFDDNKIQNCNMRPYFAASIIVELHITDDTLKPMVAVKYDGTYQNICTGQQDPKFCPYPVFVEQVLDPQILSQKQHDQLCAKPTTQEYQQQQKVTYTDVFDIKNDNENMAVYYMFAFVLGMGILYVLHLIRKVQKNQVSYEQVQKNQEYDLQHSQVNQA